MSYLDCLSITTVPRVMGLLSSVMGTRLTDHYTQVQALITQVLADTDPNNPHPPAPISVTGTTATAQTPSSITTQATAVATTVLAPAVISPSPHKSYASAA